MREAWSEPGEILPGGSALRMLEKAVETVPLGVTIAGPGGRIVYTNPAEAEMHGYGIDELRGERAAILGIAELRTPLEPERIRNWTRQSVNLRKDGSTFPVLLHSEPVTDTEGRVLGVVTCCWELDERRRMEELLRRSSLYDPLTGLPSRVLFRDRLEHALLRAERDKRPLAVLFLDLDDLRVVNTGLGHHVGDELLTVVAERLRSCVRPGDTVSRLGGDEFAVLLEEMEEAGDAVRVAERIQQELALPADLGGYEALPSASIGIAFRSPLYGRAESLLSNAEMAMYRAKAGGKGRYKLYDGAMQMEALAQLHLQTSLRRAVERGEFRLHYQPIVSLESGRIAGFEALVRWQHPRRGLLLPGEFVPLAEETGLILPIGRWVLREACAQLRSWQTGSPGDPQLFVQINVSARQFSRPGLTEEVEAALRETGIAPRTLRLEITESVVMENAETASAILARLRALGVQVHLDDFGTGFSSLSYLHRFPFDTLKIDRSFVHGMGAGTRHSHLVRTIVELAHNLEVEVVAEGVETSGQLAEVRALGCEYAQGYLFSRPMEGEAAGGLLATERVY
ncbi:MAG: EAL domain-containing protein [Chloroflexota bacterium]|nr:EAL domain-containing protein [Chloroflexota bacterium]